MSQIMKAFTGIFIVLYMMVVSIGLLGAFFEVLYAQNLHASIIDELENSNYTRGVIEESFGLAEQRGYDLELTLYSLHNPMIQIQEIEAIPSTVKDITMAKVELTYPFELAFFEIYIEQTLYGYAR